MKLNILSFFSFILLLLSDLCAAEITQIGFQDARQLLTRALEYSIQTPFCAEKKFTNADGTTKTTKYYNNGQLLLVNLQTGSRKIPSKRLIDFHNGLEYSWLEDIGKKDKIVVFKRNYLIGNYMWECVRGMLDEKRLKQGKYLLTDTIFNGEPYRKLTIRYPVTDSAITNAPATHFEWHTYEMLFPSITHLNLHRLSSKEYQQYKNELKQAYFCAFEILIDPKVEHPFIYNIQAFGNNGEPISLMSFGHVTFTDNFPGDCIYKYPSDAIVSEVTNYKDYSSQFLDTHSASYLMTKSSGDRFKDNLSAVITTINHYIANGCMWCVDILFAHGVVILLSLSFILFMIVFILKKRQQK